MAVSGAAGAGTAVLDHQRALGAYYTPPDVARALTLWALRDSSGPVLDPSYGICRFLDAAVDVLAAAGVDRPARAVHGVDIDAVATSATTQGLLRRGALVSQFTHGDFFSLRPDPRFAAVLGNPPYIRHQWQDPDVKAAAARAMNAAGVTLSRRASLWAPFLIHADRFLRPGGRLGMLLPGAALQAAYAERVWEHLADHYAQLTLLRVGERVFPDALEETVFVLGDLRTGMSVRAPLVVEVSTLDEARQALTEEPGLTQLRKRGRRRVHVRSGLGARRLLAIAAEHPAVTTLGEIAEVRIGTVTGANAFFLRTADDSICRELEEHELAHVLPGSRSLRGALWTRDDDAIAAAAGKRCRMLRLTRDSELPFRVREAIREAEAELIHERFHCAKRSLWWELPLERAPDAFLAYMAGAAKGIVRNDAGAGCVNGVHRVTWRGLGADAYLVSTWTSLWALAFEQCARHYAGGVLKLEPGAAPQLPVVRIEEPAAIRRLDDTLREEGAAAARDLADELVLAETLGFSAQQIRLIRAAVLELTERRMPPLRD
ncbi:MAG: N-6 DNA methylase [Solirubrobacteraceae bacterium]